MEDTPVSRETRNVAVTGTPASLASEVSWWLLGRLGLTVRNIRAECSLLEAMDDNLLG